MGQMRNWVWLFAMLLMPAAVEAGPWAREQGTYFVALSAEKDSAGGHYHSLYGEYGLNPRLTLGLQFGVSGEETSGLIWLQRARSTGANQWSSSFGLGAVRRDGKTVPVMQTSIAWGRGTDSIPLLKRMRGGGWVAVDLQTTIAGKIEGGARETDDPHIIYESPEYLTPETTFKAQGTLGWNATDKLKLINQLRLEDRDNTGFSAKWAGALVFAVHGPLKIELGASHPLSGDGEAALKLGTWVEF